MAAAMIAGACGLTWLGFRVTRPPRGRRPDPEADEALVVVERFEVVTIFVPSALDEWARGLSDLAPLESHDEIKSCSCLRGLEKTWYGIVYRGFESSGNVAVMPAYVRPFETAWKVQEVRDVLATIRGNPPRKPTVDFSKAAICVIPGELAIDDPGEAIAELMRRRELTESRRGR